MYTVVKLMLVYQSLVQKKVNVDVLGQTQDLLPAGHLHKSVGKGNMKN